MVQEFSENGLIIFRKIVPGSVLFVYFLLLVITSSAQTGNAESTGKTKLFIKKKLNFDTLPRKKYNFFILPLFSPPEYKVFENDPMGLFTKTGVRISANIRYLPQPWCSQKYMQTHLISINYGVLRTSLNAGYVGRFNHAVGPFDLLLKARYDWRSIENYFGTGNETQKTNSTKNYYRTVSTKFYGGIGLSTKIGNNQTFDVSAFYQNAKLKNVNSNSIYGDHGIDSSLFNNKQFGGAEVAYHFRKTNNDKFPTAGVDFFLAADYIQNLSRTNHSFKNVASAISVYIPLGRSLSIASRAGGAALVGEADFYHLNTLGGYVNLRGYDRERFAGKTIFYNNNELRWITDTKNYLFNGQIGLLGFYDIGRVWQPLEKSNKWHSGYGAGFILIPFNKVTLSGTYCTSKEGNFIQLKAGLFF